MGTYKEIKLINYFFWVIFATNTLIIEILLKNEGEYFNGFKIVPSLIGSK